MKRVMLITILLFTILVLPAISLTSAEELNDFIAHCAESGCFIYSGDGCGASPSDITYILGTYGYTNCATTTVCSGNSIVTTIRSDPWPGGGPKHDHSNRCRDARRNQCVYDVPCQTNYRCEEGGGTATCEIDINLDDTTITDLSGNTITSARLNQTVNIVVNGRNMVLIGQPLTYELRMGGITIETITRNAASETQDVYPWIAGKIFGTDFISGTYNFRITVAGETITTNDIAVPVLNLTSASFTDSNGTTITGARLNESINLKVFGSDLQGREIVYRIYRDGTLFRSFYSTATSNTEDSVPWVVGSDGTNSFGGVFSFHAEIGGFNREITFPNEIVIPELTDVFFSDLSDNAISHTGKNSLVKLNIGGLGLGNENVSYEIFEKDGGFLFFDRKVFTLSTAGDFLWRAGTDNNGTLIGGGIYYFTARTADSSVNTSFTTKTSLELNVSDIETNIPPVARITGPEDKQIYFIDEILNFTQDSYDADDGFTYQWELGDQAVFEGDSTDLGNYSVSYAFNGLGGLGQQDIKLTVTDDRGLSSVDGISILIINSTYLLAYLDSPRPGTDFGRLVLHDARSTYAVSSTTGADSCTKTIECIAGNCPSETKGCPPCYDGLDGRPDSSQCPIAVTNAASNNPPTLDNVNFCWEWYFAGNFLSSTCNTGTAGAVFDKPLRNIGLNTVILNASLI